MNLLDKSIVVSIVFGILSAISIGLADLLSIAVANRLGLIRTGFWTKLLAIAWATPFLFFFGVSFSLDSNHWILFFLLGIGNVITYLVLIRSLQLGPVSVIAPLTSLFPIVSITLAVLFLNEHLEVVQILVISIALFGASMTVFKPTKFGGISNNLTSGVLLGCVATILIGFEMFFRGALSKQVGWLLSVYVPLIISLSFFGQIAVVRREWPWERMQFGTFFLLCLASLFMVSAFFLFARGAEIGSVAIVAVAFNTYPLVPILGGIIFFKERLLISQIFGIVLMLGALALLGIIS